MKYRSLVFKLLCALCALSLPTFSAAQAASPAARLAVPSATRPLLLRAGHGCGWDYACPPEPDYGRRSSRRGDVYIHNNYGPVTVYRGDPRYRQSYPGRRGWDCPGGNCSGTGGECGAFCWMGRIRNGYCGHGCWAYKEWQRIEAEEEARRAEEDREEEERERSDERYRAFERAQSSCATSSCGRDYYDAPPPPSSYDREPPEPRYSRGRSGPPPRRRFDGPPYYPAK